MLTYTGARNLFGKLANDSSSSTLTLADTLINLFAKKISKKFNFQEDTATITSVASQQFYDLPIDFGRFKELYTTSGTTNYFPRLITSREHWDKINASTSVVGDVPQYVFIFKKQIGFYPTFTTADIESTLVYHIIIRDLSVADYTTGTIVTATNGSTAIVGDSTVWTSAMVGRYLKIPISQDGDENWYKIASVTDNTHLVVEKNYEGTSIAAGSSTYTIGECYSIPEDYQILPVFQALEIFFTSIKPDTGKASLYKLKVRELEQDLMAEHGSNTIDPRILEKDVGIININNYIQPTE